MKDKFCRFIVDESTSTSLGGTLASTVLGASAEEEARAAKPGIVAVWFDSKTCGEASAHPHARLVPFKHAATRLQKMVQAFLRARGQSDEERCYM